MAAELAHELNHPLYAILNYAKASRNVLAEEGPPNLESLRKSERGECGDRLVGRRSGEALRSFARRAESPRTACRIEEIIEEALGLVAVELRRARVAVDTSLAADSPPVQVDRVQIQQVLVNLLTNAVEAMASVAADGREIAIRTSAGEAAVEVAVCDRGPGLPPGSEAKIFEPFVSTKPDGLGMGLSIARTMSRPTGAGCGRPPTRRAAPSFTSRCLARREAAAMAFEPTVFVVDDDERAAEVGLRAGAFPGAAGGAHFPPPKSSWPTARRAPGLRRHRRPHDRHERAGPARQAHRARHPPAGHRAHRLSAEPRQRSAP